MSGLASGARADRCIASRTALAELRRGASRWLTAGPPPPAGRPESLFAAQRSGPEATRSRRPSPQLGRLRRGRRTPSQRSFQGSPSRRAAGAGLAGRGRGAPSPRSESGAGRRRGRGGEQWGGAPPPPDALRCGLRQAERLWLPSARPCAGRGARAGRRSPLRAWRPARRLRLERRGAAWRPRGHAVRRRRRRHICGDGVPCSEICA
jgi:hypothetical protein